MSLLEIKNLQAKVGDREILKGISLTVNALPAPGILQLSLIEYSWTHTTLGALRASDVVHVEADLIAKYVRQLVAPYAAAR